MKTTIIQNSFGTLQVEFSNGVPYIHCALHKWSHTLFKAYKQVFDRFMEQMASMGHPVVFVLIPDNDEKLLRFEKMFGFVEEDRDNGVILLKRYTE